MKLISIVVDTLTQAGELSNEAYHLHDGISGTGLSKIWKKSVKSFLETKRKPSDALGFGIASHAAFLEPELFKKEFYRGFDESLYPNAMRTQNDFKAFLSEHGQKVSGNKEEQIDRIVKYCKDIEIEPQIIDLLEADWDAKNKGKTKVKPKDFDQLMRMRDRLMSDPEVAPVLEGAAIERSIIVEVDFYEELEREGNANKGQWITTIKIRPDIFSSRLMLVDYKTCTDCNDKFRGEIFKFNYDLKMALQHDVLALIGYKPAGVVLLAQDKLSGSEESNPHEYVPWFLGDDVLANGRQKYLVAVKKWVDYKKSGVAEGICTKGRYVEMQKWERV